MCRNRQRRAQRAAAIGRRAAAVKRQCVELQQVFKPVWIRRHILAPQPAFKGFPPGKSRAEARTLAAFPALPHKHNRVCGRIAFPCYKQLGKSRVRGIIAVARKHRFKIDQHLRDGLERSAVSHDQFAAFNRRRPID